LAYDYEAADWRRYDLSGKTDRENRPPLLLKPPDVVVTAEVRGVLL
jgi:hypothetical protein